MPSQKNRSINTKLPYVFEAFSDIPYDYLGTYPDNCPKISLRENLIGQMLRDTDIDECDDIHMIFTTFVQSDKLHGITRILMRLVVDTENTI